MCIEGVGATGITGGSLPASIGFLVGIVVPGGLLFFVEDLAEEKIDSVGYEEQNGL